MGFDLTNERIQDTYEQLVQISGSILVDGTGSAITPDITTVSASYATTASYALNGGGGEWDEITGKPAGLVSGSSQVSYTSISDVPSGILSSSAQIADDISGSFTSTSASIASDIATNKSDITSLTAQTSSYLTSADISGKLDTTTFNSYTSSNDSKVDSLTAATSSYLTEVPSGTVSSSAQTRANMENSSPTFQDLIVNGTGSFAYIESITGSAKIIGDAYIILNNNTPTERYAGVKVFDSGSTNNSASFEFDGQTNDWFYEYTDDGGATAEHGVVLFGPGYNTKGSHVYPSNNTILKGTGDHHIVDSNITDDGTSVSVSTPLTASSFNVDSGDISFTPTTIKIGNSVAAGTEEVSLGYNISGGNGYAVNVGSNLTNNGTGGVVLIGRGSTAGGDYSIAIGEGVTTAAGAIAIGNSISAGSSNGINIGDIFKYDGTSTITLDGNLTTSGSIVVSGSGITFSDGTTQTTAAGGAGLVSGTGTDSIRSSDDLTSTPASATGNYSIALGEGADASADDAIAIGNDSNAGGGESIAIGKTAGRNGPGFRSIAMGYDTYGNGDYTVVVGPDGTTEGDRQVIIGHNAEGGSYIGSIAIGEYATSRRTNSIAIGRSSRADAANSKAIGNNVLVDHSEAILIGTSIQSTTANEINIANIFTYNSASNGEVSLKSNVETTGQIYSPTFAGSVASSTSSVDFDNGNFATLDLTVSTFLANPSNLKSGTTYTIILDSGSLISGHGTAWKFSGGTAPTYTDGTDVLTCVSDGTNLYATSLTDFQ